MKKSILLIITLSLLLFANNNKKENNLMNLKIEEKVEFSNGFGTIRARPILKDKSLENNILLNGDFNVDKKTRNVDIKFNKVTYKGKIYNLSNAFVKKARLKSISSSLDKNTTLTVSGGNQDEILNIVNAVKSQKNNSKKSSKDSDESISLPSYSSGTSGTNSNQTPNVYNPIETASETVSETTEKEEYNGALVVNCPENTLIDGQATYYIQSGAICTKRVTTVLEKKYNSKTCANKVDYELNKVEVGYETFANDYESGAYLVKGCAYEEALTLNNEIGSCKATIDYGTSKANLLKRYFFNFNNEKEYIGDCTPTKESVNLEYEINSCNDERHDFELNVSVERGQYFYNAENEKYEVGECVDIPEYTYTHFLDATTCNYNVSDGQIFYRQAVAYMNLLNQKEFATDCEVTHSGGYNLIEEFAGYSFKDSAKQAVRKVNRYFIIPDTTIKEYVDRDVETSQTYTYEETQCNLVNDDTALTTTLYNEINFQDTDENKIVNVQACEIKTITPYTRINGAGQETYEGSLGSKILTSSNGGYTFSYDGTQTVSQTNGLFPLNRSGSYNITTAGWTPQCSGGTWKVSYGSCNDGTTSTGSRTKKSCSWQGSEQYTKSEYYYPKTCNRYTYFETIGKYSINTEYLRGDGTTFNIDGGILYKITR